MYFSITKCWTRKNLEVLEFHCYRNIKCLKTYLFENKQGDERIGYNANVL